MLVADMTAQSTQTWLAEDQNCQLADLGDDRPDTVLIHAWYDEVAIPHQYPCYSVPVTEAGPGSVAVTLVRDGYTCILCDEKSSSIDEGTKHFVTSHSHRVGTHFVCYYPLGRGTKCNKVIISLVS